jgi:hypothetical protein
MKHQSIVSASNVPPAPVWGAASKPPVVELTASYDSRSPDFLDIFEDEDVGDATLGR